MPGMGGRELWERLSCSRREMKAVFVSGYTDDAMIHHGMLPPGVGFLQKPFMGAALVRKVREILDSEDGKA